MSINKSIIYFVTLFSILFSLNFSGCIDSQSVDILKGQISIADSNVSFNNASVHIKIIDSSNTSKISDIVWQESLGNITVNKGKNNTFPYFISIDKLEKNEQYSLFVHVDADKDGKVSRGDLIAINEILVNDNSNDMDVIVNLVSKENLAISTIFTEINNNDTVNVKPNQLCKIALKENQSTDYRWHMIFSPELVILKDQFIPDIKDYKINVNGTHEWIFNPSKPGTYNISGVYKKQGENLTQNQTKYSLQLYVY